VRMSRHQEDNSWITSAGVVLGAVTSAVINELHAGWPWWIAAVVLIGATAWLARQPPSTSGAHRSTTSSDTSGKLGRWWGPATAVAATVGSAAIVWWPLRWRPEWLGFMPERLLQFLLWVLLVVGLCTLALKKLRAAGAALLVVFLAGLAVAPPAAAVADRQCGTAMIVTQPSLMAAVDAALDTMRNDAAVECAEALWPVRADTDVQAQLRNSAAVVGGLITSDPRLIGKLRSSSAEFRVVAEPVESWTGIGNDVASVFLPSGRDTRSDNSVPFRRSVPLRALPALAFPAATPTDPVAMRTALTLAHGRRLSPSTTGFGAGQGTCPTGVVIAGSWVDPPCGHADLVRATILGDSGRAIGVPVFGVPLRPSGLYGPGKQARKAVTALFQRLSLGLANANLVDPPDDVDAAVEQSKDLKPLAVPKPVHLIAVLDASLSTGSNADLRDRGGLPPLKAGLDGLVIADQAPDRPDRTSIMLAQDSIRDTVQWSAGVRPVPAVTAKGTTKLPVFLARAQALRAQAGRQGQRPVIVLLTDGVNLFSEYPVPETRLRDVVVLVIGNSRGCAAVPERLRGRTRCFPARGSAADVAGKLARALTVP